MRGFGVSGLDLPVEKKGDPDGQKEIVAESVHEESLACERLYASEAPKVPLACTPKRPVCRGLQERANVGLDHWAMRDFTSKKKMCVALRSTIGHGAEFLVKARNSGFSRVGQGAMYTPRMRAHAISPCH
jgi:hypothetical protein